MRPDRDHGPRQASSRWARSTSSSAEHFKERAVRFDRIDGLHGRRARRRCPRCRRSSATTARSCSTRATSARPSGPCSPWPTPGRRAAEPRDPPGDARRRLPRPDRPGAAGLTERDRCVPCSALTLANIRSYLRDRAAVFWTLAFPLDLHLHVRLHLPGRRQPEPDARHGWTRTGRPRRPSCTRRSRPPDGVKLTDGADRAAAEAAMKDGEVDAIIVVPAGYGAALGRGVGGQRRARPRSRSVTDPSRSTLVASVDQAVGSVLGVVNLGGRPPLVVAAAPRPSRPRTSTSSATSCRASSGMSIMQIGIFAADPAGRRPREAHPQAPRGDAAAALAAGRLERR